VCPAEAAHTVDDKRKEYGNKRRRRMDAKRDQSVTRTTGVWKVLNDEREMPEVRLDDDEDSTGIIKLESGEEVGSGDLRWRSIPERDRNPLDSFKYSRFRSIHNLRNLPMTTFWRLM
jgi:hypothetical protein